MKPLPLNMLGLYLYTFIISYKSCKMLSKLNKLTLQNLVTNNVFLDKMYLEPYYKLVVKTLLEFNICIHVFIY